MIPHVSNTKQYAMRKNRNLSINTTSNEAVIPLPPSSPLLLLNTVAGGRNIRAHTLTSHCMVISSANEAFREYFSSHFSRMETSVADLILCWLHVNIFFLNPKHWGPPWGIVKILSFTSLFKYTIFRVLNTVHL